jgi:hypothetical protein
MLYQYKYNLAMIPLLEILFPRKPKYLLGIQILQIWPKQLLHHMVHKLSLHNKIEMQKSNFFLEFLQQVHHVVGYLSGLAVAIYELLACEKFSENLLQSTVYVVRYDSVNPPDDVNMLMFLLFSGSYNHIHDIVQSFTLPHHSLWIPGLFLPFLSIPRSPWEVLVHSHPIPSSFLVHSQNRGEWVWGGKKGGGRAYEAEEGRRGRDGV